MSKGRDYTPLFRGALTLNSRKDPSRLITTEEGLVELAEAVNVDIDDSYRVSRRGGAEATDIAVPVQTVWGTGDHLFCVIADTLYAVGSGWALSALQGGLTQGVDMAFKAVESQVYFSNGYQTGIIDLDSMTTKAWQGQAYVGPPTSRSFSDPPAGHLIEYYAGRMWIGAGNILYFTEPFALSWVDMAKNLIPFRSRLRVVREVRSGLVISSSQALYFFGGSNPDDMQVHKLALYPAIEGTDVALEGEDMPEEMQGGGVILTTTQGICVVDEAGSFRNLTRDRIDYPPGSKGCAYLYRGKYVTSFEI